MVVNKGAFEVIDEVSVLVEADDHRKGVFLQHLSGGPIYLGFGKEDPVVGEGLVLWYEIPGILVDDNRANMVIRGICGELESASGAYSIS